MIFQSNDTNYEVSWHTPAGVMIYRGNASLAGQVLAYHAVAHGLSRDRQKWPLPQMGKGAVGSDGPDDNGRDYPTSSRTIDARVGLVILSPAGEMSFSPKDSRKHSPGWR